MKKILLIIGGILLFLLIALAVIPFIFKDKIKAKIDTELAKNVNAQIIYDVNKFHLSIFKNFPNLTISIDDFAIIAKQPEFKGDTLFAAKTMSFAANIMSVINGEKIEVNSIYLLRPTIVTIMAKNGVNSWSTLMIPSSPDSSTTKEPVEPTEFKVAFKKWEIEDGKIIYDDASLPMYALLDHVNHSGSGDLTQEVVDVETITKSPNVLIIYDNVTYLKNHALNADMSINMNYVKGFYKFLKNEISINNFTFGFDGSLALLETEKKFDLTFKAKETAFKNLLSLIPSVFLKDYDKIKTDGNIAFDGYVKGTMSEKLMPGYGLNLKINKAMLKYPDLPTAVTNISTDLSVDNKEGITEKMNINVRQFHMDMGKNPVDAKVNVQGLNPSVVDANIVANVNLAEITSIFPVEGTVLKGNFSLNAKAKGVYNDKTKTMPVVDAKMALQNGYVKSKEVPAPLENVNFTSAITSNGQMSDTKVWVNNFNMTLENEPFNIKAYVENLDDPSYDVTIKGIIDLAKMTKIYPLEGMSLLGRINADIETKGIMSDVEAGRYGKTATKGTMDIKNFKYTSTDLPQGLSLSSANFSLSPDKMTINEMIGYAGKSDINIKGFFSNYMGYLFGKQDTTIRGNMRFLSNTFDANEWMTEDKNTSAPTTSASSGPFEVPKDIDFVFAANINTVKYTNMTLQNLTGNIVMKDGAVKMDNLKFNTLGGNFLVNGNYNTQDIVHPKFGMDIKMNKVKISEAYTTFNSIQTLAPVAKDMQGDFTMDLNMNGELDKQMMPVYPTISGAGKTIIESAQVKGNKVLSGISGITKMSALDPLTLKDVLIKFAIADGRLKVEPFDINSGNFKMNLGGTNGLDGSMDYLVKMDVPAGAIGTAVNNALSQLTGKNTSNAQTIKMNFKVGGTTSDPKISLAGTSMEGESTNLKEAAIDKAKEEFKNNAQVQKAKEDLEKAKKETEDKVRAEAERAKKETEDKLREEAERVKKETEDKVKQQAEDVLKDKLKKKLPF